MLQLTTLTTATTANKAITTKPELRALDFRCNTQNISGFRDSGSGPCSVELNAGLSANCRLEMLRNTSLLPGHYIFASNLGFRGRVWALVYGVSCLPCAATIINTIVRADAKGYNGYNLSPRVLRMPQKMSLNDRSLVFDSDLEGSFLYLGDELHSWGVSSAKLTRGRIPPV